MTQTAVLTMVYESYRFLEKWVAYYGDLFDEKNLFIVSHGGDPKHAEIGANCNIINVPRVFSPDFDITRWAALSDYAAGLNQFYDYVICGDCDELITTDPQCGYNLPEYMAQKDVSRFCPLGLHLLPMHHDQMITIDWNAPLLGQVTHAIVDGSYAKPSITRVRRNFSPGGHEAEGEALALDRNLLLCHLKYLDEERLALAHKIAIEVREIHRQNAAQGVEAERWPMSSIWQFGRNAEQVLLDRLCNAPSPHHPDPLLFARRFIHRNARMLPDGTRSYRGVLRQPRKIQFPERFEAVF
jgi:hypothetical protein